MRDEKRKFKKNVTNSETKATYLMKQKLRKTNEKNKIELINKIPEPKGHLNKKNLKERLVKQVWLI